MHLKHNQNYQHKILYSFIAAETYHLTKDIDIESYDDWSNRNHRTSRSNSDYHFFFERIIYLDNNAFLLYDLASHLKEKYHATIFTQEIINLLEQN